MHFSAFGRLALLFTFLLSFSQAEECRAKCGITTSADLFPRRFLGARSLETICTPTEDERCTSDWTKRTLDRVGRGGTAIGTYMKDTVDAIERQRGKPNAIMFKIDRSTSRIKALGQESFDFGMSGLCGCTLLVIVSNTHIYGGHYFEDLAFDDTNENADPPKTENTADFQGQVINFLSNGGNGRKHGTEGPRLAGLQNEFPVDQTKAYIMAPARGTKLLYEDLVNQMADHVQTLIGTRPIIKPYVPVDQAVDATRPRPLLDTERGRLLYQLDVDNGVRTQRLLWQSESLSLSTETLP
ncbi:hypothetical protein CC78DRAFT_567598 [Lojkania enalia]|uniref:Uncharacterized protein n=1 Tax=Lojkania enalia TaxID=147567 RepID=A0A9P4KFE7_9PLEO|nr:hypothetical protein CC78DRAFT_567598 [Didymosphaeria enalia]